MEGVRPTNTRHGESSDDISRSAAIVTGLRAASVDPFSKSGVNDIAGSPDSTRWASARERFAMISPLLSVLPTVASILIGAPAIGVSCIVNLKVIGAAGIVGVAVGVTVGVGVNVAVGVMVGVGVAVGVLVGVGVTVGVRVAVLVGDAVGVTVGVDVGV